MARNKLSQAPVQGGGLIVGNGPSAGGRGPVRAPVRAFADGVTNTDTGLVSATAVFVAGDVGAIVQGAGIPPGTFIQSRTNATTVVLSQATTATATSVSVTLIPTALGHPYFVRKIAYITALVTPTNPIVAQTVDVETVTLTGVRTGDLVIAIPPPNLEASVTIDACFVSAADTIKLRLGNPTAGNLATAAKVWSFLWLQLS